MPSTFILSSKPSLETNCLPYLDGIVPNSFAEFVCVPKRDQLQQLAFPEVVLVVNVLPFHFLLYLDSPRGAVKVERNVVVVFSAHNNARNSI